MLNSKTKFLYLTQNVLRTLYLREVRALASIGAKKFPVVLGDFILDREELRWKERTTYVSKSYLFQPCGEFDFHYITLKATYMLSRKCPKCGSEETRQFCGDCGFNMKKFVDEEISKLKEVYHARFRKEPSLVP